MVPIFWICLGLIAYTYLLYPISIFVLSRMVSPRPEPEENTFPKVAMIIAAYNEEEVLEKKIANCLSLKYPRDRIRFLFGSDGSTDLTNQILSTQDHPQIQSTLFPEREGKSSVLNKLVAQVDEEIVLFSDANTLIQPGSLSFLTRHFADPGLGGVCGELRLVNSEGNPGGKGEGLYWRYETMIKRAEGILKSVISSNGAIFAVRRKLIEPLPVTEIVNDDFSITLSILKKNYRVVYEPRAEALEYASPSMEGEFKRKIRISTLNFNALPEILPLLNPRYGFIALSILSHKIIRWLVPLLGFGLLLSNILLFDSGGFYKFTLLGQGIIYFGALLGFLGDRLFKDSGPFIPFYYLAMINVAIVIGFFQSFTGSQKGTWERVPH